MRKTIWIIDDDPGILEVTEIILQEAGYNVNVINNVIKIKEFLADGTPDLILLDILMSGFDGREVAKNLRADPQTMDIPIIMMSADTHIEQKAAEAGANTYLRKPFDIEQLEEIVKQYMNE